METKKYCVYMHKNKINGKVYIGQTCDIKSRFAQEGRYYKNCPAFYNAIVKYGWDNFEHIILKDNLTKEEADKWEIYYIKEFKAQDKRYGYNIVSGGQANNECHQKPVTAYNIRTKEVIHFSSRVDAALTLWNNKNGVNDIALCIAGFETYHNKKRITTRGYMFFDGIVSKSDIASIAEETNKLHKKALQEHHYQQVTIEFENGNIITMESQKAAREKYNIAETSFNRWLNDGKFHRGMKLTSPRQSRTK